MVQVKFMPKIFFYQTPTGKKGIDDFFVSLPDIKTKAKIIAMLRRLESSGHSLLKPPEAKKLTDNIWELRIRYKSNAYRLLFFTLKDERFIITNGFIKKTDKTPPKEIEKAEKYRQDYLNNIKEV